MYLNLILACAKTYNRRTKSNKRKSCADMHCMMPSFCICTPGKEVGLIMRLYAPKN